MTIEPSATYEAERASYWRAQEDFRDLAQAEMIRLMPEGIAALVIELNDADPPRLSVVAYRDPDGTDHYPEDWADGADDQGRYDALDQIAADLDVSDWHEADGFLFGDPDDLNRFVVEREA